MTSFFRRVPVPWHKKQGTYETTEKRIPNGKTTYMLRGVVSHIARGRRQEGLPTNIISLRKIRNPE